MNMQTVAIDAASEGMVLAQDLCDAGGAILLPRGATLSELTLKSLRRRGVEAIDIISAEAVPDEAALLAARERCCLRLHHLFRHSAEREATPLLLARLLQFRCGGAP